METENLQVEQTEQTQTQAEQTQTPELKLRTKTITFISLGFFAVLMFWQLYNYYVPQILTNMLTARNVSNVGTVTGAIIAADSAAAIVIMLLVGAISDKRRTRFGKRMPFIVVASLITVVALPFLPILFLLNSMAGVIVVIGVILTTMNVVRPATVALMPDITPKPLRPKANAIVNFIGYIGAILAGGLAMLAGMLLPAGANSPVTERSWILLMPFIVACVAIVVAVVVMLFKVKENKLAEELKDELDLGERLAETEAAKKPDGKLTRRDKRNLFILCGAMFFWWFAFNAVESWWGVYGNEGRLGGGPLVSFGPAILAIASLATFLPAVKLTKKMGRKWSVVLGIGLVIAAVIPMTFLTTANALTMLGFVVAGAGWAIINVNAFPMFVEFSRKENVGKFTGYYYIVTMSAQAITPIFAGFIVGDTLGWWALFPYTAIFMAVALAFMLFFKPRNSTAPAPLTSNH
jgi:MFS family permease